MGGNFELEVSDGRRGGDLGCVFGAHVEDEARTLEGTIVLVVMVEA